MRVLKGVFGCFCALSEPSVRFRINGLRFVSVLSRQRSRVRAPSSPPFIPKNLGTYGTHNPNPQSNPHLLDSLRAHWIGAGL